MQISQRKHRWRALLRSVVALFAAASCWPAHARADTPLPLATLASIRLPGAATRFDYESLDPITHRLFLAHLATSEVVIYDVKNDRVVATIPDIAHVHGVLAVPELGRVYATATGTNEVVVIDARTLKVIDRIPGGTYPDGLAFDPDDRKLYVSDEHGDTDTVIDTRTDTRLATIALGGDVGNTQYDARSHRIYVNVQTTGQLVSIDPATDRVVAKYQLTGCEGNHGLQLDDAHRSAYIACEGNAKLVVFDLARHESAGAFTVGDDPDVLAYDRKKRTLYVAAESGSVAMFFAKRGGLVKLGQGFLGKNAHIVAVDQESHRVYFPVLADGGPTMLVTVSTAKGEPRER